MLKKCLQQMKPSRLFCTAFSRAAMKDGLNSKISEILNPKQLQFLQDDMDPYLFSSRSKISELQEFQDNESQMAVNLEEFYDTINSYHTNLVSTQLDTKMNKKLNQFISKSAFNLDEIQSLRELVDLGYKIEAINGRSAVFWYFYWCACLKFFGVWENQRRVEDGSYYEPEDIEEQVKSTSAQDKLDFLGFWIVKQLRDPAEELVLDHLNTIIKSIDLENESEILNLKTCLYLIETGKAEIVEPRANENDPLVFKENVIKSIFHVSILGFIKYSNLISYSKLDGR